MFIRFISLLLLTAFLTVSASAETVYYLVRHAEKVKDGSRDPALTELGKARAETIKEMMPVVLADKRLTAVFSSDYQRTRDTALPTARSYDLSLKLYNPGKLEAFANKLKTMSGHVMVAGHSNTTPPLVNLLAGTSYKDLEDHQYDHFYKITKNNDGLWSVEILYINPRTP